MRAERIALYRRLIQSASAMLADSAGTVWSRRGRRPGPKTLAEWVATLAEADMVAARSVLDAARAIDELRKRRDVERFLRQAEEADDPPDQRAADELTDDEIDERTQEWFALTNENEAQVAALIAACREDVAALRQA